MAGNASKLESRSPRANRDELAKIVVVRWLDHDAIHDPTWIKPEDFDAFDSDITAVTSVGFPVHENETFLVLAQQLQENGTVGDCMRILKSAIVDIVHTDGSKVMWSRGKPIFRYEHSKPE